jgi:hypothetical protein
LINFTVDIKYQTNLRAITIRRIIVKKSRYYSYFIVVMLILFHLAGCGKGEDEARDVNKQVVPEAAAPKNIPGPAENITAASQKTEPAQVTESKPTESTKAADAEPTGPPEVTESEQAAQVIADVVIIENQGYEQDRKGPVKFNHLKHNKEYKASCVECHHLYQDGRNIWKEGDHVDKCVDCHDPAEEKEQAIRLQSAFHNNCRGCHTEMNKQGKKAPDKKCNDCHG